MQHHKQQGMQSSDSQMQAAKRHTLNKKSPNEMVTLQGFSLHHQHIPPDQDLKKLIIREWNRLKAIKMQLYRI